jgi:hypothetical protein
MPACRHFRCYFDNTRMELAGLEPSARGQQLQGGLVEARCGNGLVLTSGDVLATATG